jgi:hypothetical protein
MDENVFVTTVQIDKNEIVSSISNSYLDENQDLHTETIEYSGDPFISHEDTSAHGMDRSLETPLDQGMKLAEGYYRKIVKDTTQTKVL